MLRLFLRRVCWRRAVDVACLLLAGLCFGIQASANPSVHRASEASTPCRQVGSPIHSDTEYLIAGLQAYEASIQSISWTEAGYLPPSSDVQRSSWLLRQESSRYWDRSWRWVIDGRTAGSDPPDYVLTYYESTVVCDGVRRLSWVPGEAEGLLTQPDESVVGGTQLLRALGRSLDLDGAPFTAPLSTLLLQAKVLTFMAPTAEEPWPGLRAEDILRRHGMDVEIRVDPANLFAPRLIRVIRPKDGLVADELLVLSYQDCQSIPIPRVCVHGAYYAQIVDDLSHPVSAQRLADMRDALRLEGLPEELQTLEVRRAVARMQSVRVMDDTTRRVSGLMLVFDAGEGLLGPQILLVREVSLNRASDLCGAFRSMDRAGRVFDGFTRQWITLEDAVAQISESPLNPLLEPCLQEESEQQ